MTETTTPDQPQAPHLQIISSGANAADVAAVTAVLRAALDELAAELEIDPGVGQSAWQRSQRAIRGTISPGNGTWRGFSG